MSKKIAVILCGSGYLDGSEIRESVAALWALDKCGAEVSLFAPDAPQTDVVNHLTEASQPGETRQILVESARIARSRVAPLSKLDPSLFDGIVLPGGYGVAKNLCTFATRGAQATVRADIQSILQSFHRSGKPMGAICIAPALLALALRDTPLELTLGQAGEAAQEIEKLGHKHIVCATREIHSDRKNRIISTPAYMDDNARLHEVFLGIEKLVTELLALT